MSPSEKAGAIGLFAVAILLLAPAPVVFAKVTAVTLAELVQESTAIVYGHITDAGDPARGPTDWVPFEASRVIKGPASLHAQTVRLCRSPPPMKDYPDISKWKGYEVFLFLSPRGADCFELSHSYVSIVEVHDGKASTVEIEDQPKAQPFERFLKKIDALVSKQARQSASGIASR
jgi:hypothetical protein